MHITEFARELKEYLGTLPGVKECRLYGSLSTGTYDEYSDVDIQLDVSGQDNGLFVLELPKLLSERYSLIFYDYAPSLAPEKYVVSFALDGVHPFRMVDIGCTAAPHCGSVSRAELSRRNDRYDHLLKLFVANLKHHLRGTECHRDILKMYSRIFEDRTADDDTQMLKDVYGWLVENSSPKHIPFVAALREYL